jgi:hypothetical protein
MLGASTSTCTSCTLKLHVHLLTLVLSAYRPFGGISIASFVFLLPGSPPMGHKNDWRGWGTYMFLELAKCDWFGAAIILAWSTCFILALQWGVSRGAS